MKTFIDGIFRTPYSALQFVIVTCVLIAHENGSSRMQVPVKVKISP